MACAEQHRNNNASHHRTKYLLKSCGQGHYIDESLPFPLPRPPPPPSTPSNNQTSSSVFSSFSPCSTPSFATLLLPLCIALSVLVLLLLLIIIITIVFVCPKERTMRQKQRQFLFPSGLQVRQVHRVTDVITLGNREH